MDNKFSREASIAYLKTVLGVEAFILPLVSESEAQVGDIGLDQPQERLLSTSGPDESPFVIVVEANSVSNETSSLLERMVTAMKQNIDELLVVKLHSNVTPEQAIPVLANHPRKAVLIFGAQAGELLSGGKKLPMAQWLAPLPEVPVLVTYGLEEIQAQPDLKKTVWQHLQMIMQNLG